MSSGEHGLDERILRYLDGETSEQEERQLAATLRANAQARSRFSELSRFHGEITTILMESMATDGEQSHVKAVARSRWSLVVAVAAAVVVAVGLWWMWNGTGGIDPRMDAVIARTLAVTGNVTISNQERGTRSATSGMEFGPGDTILTGTNGEVELTWNDGTRITMREDSEFGIRIADCRMPNGSYRKGLRLERGSVSASVAKQPKGFPMTVGTPHARCTVVGTRCFLMVANGMTTNRTAWSFTRVDVTEGRILFGSSELPVSAGAFAAAGTDHEGRAIRTASHESDGTELSAKYGGVFFRNAAETYAKDMMCLDSSNSWKSCDTRTYDAGQMASLFKSESSGVSAFVRKFGELSVLVVQNKGDRTAKGYLDLGLPHAAMLSVDCEVRFASQGSSFSLTSLRRLNAYLPKELAARNRYRAAVLTPESLHRFRFEYLCVGCTADGDRVYESSASSDGTRTVQWQRDHAPAEGDSPRERGHGFGISLGPGEVLLQALKVTLCEGRESASK